MNTLTLNYLIPFVDLITHSKLSQQKTHTQPHICILYVSIYIFLFADLPEPVKNCTAYNATANSLQIQCIPGYDGGIPQHFHAQIYDELTRQILYNASYKYPEFTVKRLPSDSAFNIRVTAVNAQGPSKVAYRVRGRTLSAPLLRTGR